VRRTSKDVPDLLSGLDSGAAALNNARVVRDARADHDADASATTDWRKNVRPRLAFVGAIVVVWSLCIVVRLVHLQVFQHDALVLRAESQQSQTIEINPRRGPILDRFGRLLAYSVDGDVIYAVPSDVEDPDVLASSLCNALDGCDDEERRSLVQRLDSRRGRSTVLSTLSPEEADGIASLKQDGFVVDRGKGGRTGSLKVVTRELTDTANLAERVCRKLTRCDDDQLATIEKGLQGKKDFVYIRKRATPAEAQRVAAMKLPGVGFLNESRRYYPNRDLASSLLGFVNARNHGVGGLELTHNKLVTGTPGTLIVQQDAQQHVLAARVRQAPTAGVTLELTIDARLQFIAERELRAAVDEHGAIGGTVVMMDPHTGEILALVSEPHFNPNDSSKVDRVSRVNRAAETIYEPGSTFKTITAAAALEEGVIQPTDIVDATMPCRFGTAKAITDVHQVGVVSFEKVFAKSSNCGTARVAVNRLGTEKLMRYVNRFGFGVRATRDFPAESAGIVRKPNDIKEHDLARIAIGYTIAVTPLQMAAAMSAVANGGELLKPRIVRATVAGGVRTVTSRDVIRRAISPRTSARLTTMMEAVVEEGTAKAARVKGYTLAAKTGTARKLNANGGGYMMEYMASTAGFFPSRNPAVAMIVVIDAPKRKGYFGGAVAAPVFQRIADATLRHLAIAPNVDRQPPIVVARAGDGPSISPVSNEGLSTPRVMAGARAELPDLSNLSAREAVRTLIELGWEPRLRGEGSFVARQSAPPGTPVGEGGVCLLHLSRYPVEPEPVGEGEP
jgi:cell division protein FtsI (penicillin-binding protein 3)